MLLVMYHVSPFLFKRGGHWTDILKFERQMEEQDINSLRLVKDYKSHGSPWWSMVLYEPTNYWIIAEINCDDSVCVVNGIIHPFQKN